MFILRAPKVLVIQLKVIDPQSSLFFCFGQIFFLVYWTWLRAFSDDLYLFNAAVRGLRG